MGHVPMWEEDGHCMVESASILRYLADKHKVQIHDESIYPESPELR